ncbi:putative ACR [uncultured archaeon]|nr:putative ACR [uncultured archaeon]
MEVVNETAGKTIVSGAKKADTLFSRAKGLLFTKTPSDLVLVSPREGVKESSIHMVGMNYPIDVIWADKDGVVVDVQKGVAPSPILKPWKWRVFRPAKPAAYVVECGSARVDGVSVGDKLRFNSSV